MNDRLFSNEVVSKMKFCSSHYFAISCLLILFQTAAAVHADAAKQNICFAEDSSCSSKLDGETIDVKEKVPAHHVDAKGNGEAGQIPEEDGDDSLLHLSMQGLEGVLDQMANSKDKMMHGLMDKMSESRTKMMEGIDSVMEKVSKSKEKVMEGLDNVIDKVSHSKMMEEIDHVLESVSHSNVLKEIRALPREIRESFILSARNRSYIVAGILMSISSAILFGGAIYYAWCHHDAWSYYIGTIEDAKALLRQAKETGLMRRSRSTSEDSSVVNSVSYDNLSPPADGDVRKDESDQALSAGASFHSSSETDIHSGELCENDTQRLICNGSGEQAKDDLLRERNGHVSVVDDEKINHCQNDTDTREGDDICVEGKKDK